MKKIALLLVVLLILSTGTMAAGTGMLRTAVETGNRQNTDGTSYNFTNWILIDGFFKSSYWENFQLGYTVNKTHTEDEDHNGAEEIELRPGYNKVTNWGNYGGQLIFEQGRYSNNYGGWDGIKPELWLTYNLNNKSRIYARTLYYRGEVTDRSDADDWVEAEIQYKYDIAGGTLGTGVFAGDGMEEEEADEIRGLLNYNKYFSESKIYTNFYSELRFHRDIVDNTSTTNKWKSYKIGVYVNRPIWKGLVLEAETNIYQDFDETWDLEESYRELFFMAGLRYNY